MSWRIRTSGSFEVENNQISRRSGPVWCSISPRRTYGYRTVVASDEEALSAAIFRLARQYGRCGYGDNESFNSKLGDELLKGEIFCTL